MTDVRVRVLDGYAVYDGETQRGAGDEFEVPADLAGRWSIAGWVELVEPAKAKRKRAVDGEQLRTTASTSPRG